MNKILGLCINFLLLVISDAVPLKLIAGDRSVVKKDGATHTISKYYVVPNDYDPNNVTNTTVATQEATLRMHSLHSNRMDSGKISEEINENKATTVNDQSNSNFVVENNNAQVHFISDLNVGQGELSNQPDSTGSTVSIRTEQTVDSDDLGNLQVEPIINPINLSRNFTDEIDTNINSGEGVQNGSLFTVVNETEQTDIEDKLHDLILTKFGIAVHERYSQNLESFWKLIKLNIDKNSGDDELLAAVERLPLLLNIFTNLYEAAQLKKPVAKMIDGIIEILQIPFIEKSIGDETQAETNISGDYDKECLRKCGRRNSKPQLDSNGTSLSETKSQQASDSSELENFQKRHRVDLDDKDLIKMSEDPDSNQVTVGNEAINVLRSQLSVPYNLNEGVPNGNNVLNTKTTLHPFINEHRTTNKLTWSIKTRTDPTWTIENKLRDSPMRATASFQSSDPSVTTHGDNILFNPNQSVKSTVHNVINGTKKPYHVNTYAINPTTSLYEVPNAGNVVQMVSRKPYENFGSTLYGLPTLHSGNQVVYENQPSQSQYESQYSLSKPTINISNQPSYSQVTHTNNATKTYDSSHEANPSNLRSQTPQEDNELQYLLGYGSEPNHKPALLQSNTYLSESQPNSGEENEAPTVPEIDSPPRVLLMNVPSNPFVSMISLGNTEPVSTASANSGSSVVTSDFNPDIDDQHTEQNSYNLNDNAHLIQASTHPAMANKANQSASVHASVQTSQYPGVSSSSASTYKNSPDEPDYGGHIHQQPGAISTASAHSETNVQDDYDVPTPLYGEDRNNYAGYISKATSHFESNVHNDNYLPTPVYGKDTNNYPGFISQSTGHSEHTNVPNDYTYLAPDNRQYTNTRPGQISKVLQFPKHPNVLVDFDDSIPVNGIKIQKNPGYISKASSNSEFTVPINYNVPINDYGDDTDFYPGKIQNVPDYPEYTNGVNHHIKVQPGNSGPTQSGNNYLVPYQPYGHKVHVIYQPRFINHLIKTIPGNQNPKLKLAPTYRLFIIQNLQDLENAISKTIQMHGPGVHDDRALINLKKIINVILILAENLKETGGTNAWYEKIFYNSQHSQHPLQHYVYKLIRQRWLHELMLVLYKNNFSLNTLQSPGILSFLESWQFPEYVQDFMKAEELIRVLSPQDYDDISYNQNHLQEKFSTHTFDDSLENVPENLGKYVTNNVIDSYKSRNDGLFLRIVEAQSDANAIIEILQNYLHYKNYIETQEDVIIRDNKVDMLKKIILFLREKGYGPNTIADLIRKLNTAVYSTEGRGCHTHHTNFAKNMYDVILPVLRRSERARKAMF